MPVRTQVTIRGKPVSVVGSGSKSDLARALLDQGYSVSEISKAVPMAYSQVHQLAKKGNRLPSQDPDRRANIEFHTSRKVKPVEPTARNVTPGWGDLPKKGKPATTPQKAKILKRAERLLAPPSAQRSPSGRVGKLRTPGMPSDVVVGACANCGYDLAVRKGSGGLFLIHINTTAEEYLAVTQFCQAVPEVLIGG